MKRLAANPRGLVTGGFELCGRSCMPRASIQRRGARARAKRTGITPPGRLAAGRHSTLASPLAETTRFVPLLSRPLMVCKALTLLGWVEIALDHLNLSSRLTGT